MEDELRRINCVYEVGGISMSASLAMLRTADNGRVPVVIPEGTDPAMVEYLIDRVRYGINAFVRSGAYREE